MSRKRDPLGCVGLGGWVLRYQRRGCTQYALPLVVCRARDRPAPLPSALWRPEGGLCAGAFSCSIRPRCVRLMFYPRQPASQSLMLGAGGALAGRANRSSWFECSEYTHTHAYTRPRTTTLSVSQPHPFRIRIADSNAPTACAQTHIHSPSQRIIGDMLGGGDEFQLQFHPPPPSAPCPGLLCTSTTRRPIDGVRYQQGKQQGQRRWAQHHLVPFHSSNG